MLNRNISINEIITSYPKVQEFLLLNDVDCMKCHVKTCLLKDILEYHNFSASDQVLMYEHMDKLAEGLTDEMPKFIPEEFSTDFSPLVDALINEHKYIKELIYSLKYISTKKDFLNNYKNDIAVIADYLSKYADEFHHQKEEDLLFCLFRGKEIVEAMYEEHTIGRDLRKGLLNSKSDLEASEYIEQFCGLLENHIYKEDNVLFPYLDKHLKVEDIERTAKLLTEYDLTLEEEVKKYLREFRDREFSL